MRITETLKVLICSKKCLSLVVLLLHFTFSFGQLTDDFEDGTLLSNPVWQGDLDKFTIEDGQLRSASDVVSDEFYLGTASQKANDAEWRITVNMRFSTSSANYSDIFLVSDSLDFSQAQNAYFVRIGNTKDEVSLYKLTGGNLVQLTDGTDGKTQNKTIKLRVLRSSTSEWEIWVDYDGGENYSLEGQVVDSEHTTSSYFGINIKQSSASFHNKHFFDDIYVGNIIRDTTAPKITGYLVPNENEIQLTFDEPVNTANTSFLLSDGYGNPNEISTNQNLVTLRYTNELITGEYDLTINGIEDFAGNSGDTSIKLTVDFPEVPIPSELLITEVFPDPSPQVGLPEAEFIEIYINNPGGKNISLKDCYLTDGGDPAIFPNYTTNRSEYLILTKSSNVSLFEPYGEVIGLTDFPTLNNGGDDLKIIGPNDLILDELIYSDDFYQDELREDGGYSIERVFFESNCIPIKNWRASLSSDGGTPGKQNSVFNNPLDTLPPTVESLTVNYPDTLILIISEEVISTSLGVDNFELVENGGNPLEVIQEETKLSLVFSDVFKKNQVYTLRIDSLCDCLGNEAADISLQLITTERPSLGDVIFNELLFDPIGDGVDYIELYNRSEKFIDLKELKVGRFTDVRENIYPISNSTKVLFPEEYILLSTDTNSTKEQYVSATSLWEVDRLPPMNNDEGNLLLLIDSQLVDSVNYSDEQHFELLSDVEGVSLERINFKGDSWDKNLWHSASSSVQFGTPGTQNSQFISSMELSSTFSLLSKTISPNGDGFEDLLALNYATETGEVLNGYVFNLNGILVEQIINQETLGSEGTLTWNGILSNGTRLPIGNYILLLESFNLDGQTSQKKLAFSVLSDF